MAATGKILVRLVDGARDPFGREATVSLFDGAQRRVHMAVHPKPNIEFTIPTSGGLNDTYRVVVNAKDHLDAGQTGIPLRANAFSIVDLMLIPKRSQPAFRQLAELDRVHPRLRPLLEDFLRRRFGSAGDDAYLELQRANTAGLMTLLSISSAFADFAPPDHPLDFVEALLDLQPDRFYARATDRMLQFLENRAMIFKDADSSLHPDAFKSFKESRHAEGNVQFTFARLEDPTLLKVDCDIDLFADQLSHFFLEVLPNDVFNPPSRTDPRRAYAMRWMSVQRTLASNPAGKFDPPFTLQLG